MFLGHFAMALAAKKADRQLSLGATVLAAQWLDLLWPVLLLTGTESAAIAPAGAAIPLEFTHYPVSHSLLAVVGWALLFAAITFAITRRNRSSWMMALLVLSHWLLDLLVHVPDLPLAFSQVPKWGLGLWLYKIPELMLEMGMFAVAVYLYWKAVPLSTLRARWAWVSLVTFLVVVHIMNSFGAPPPSVQAVAYVGLSQWLLVAWAWWADRKRPAVAMAR